MLYDNPDPGNVSMKRPPAGQYPAVLIGVCYVGSQGGGKFGERPQVMLRWEMHDDEGEPCLDETGKVFAATQIYNATIRDNLEGKPSTLARVLNAHGIATTVGARVDSTTWPGKAAVVTVERSGDESQYANVVQVDPLDEGVTLTPFSTLEHWEPQPGQETRKKNPPPPWAEWKVAMSSDINHLSSPQFRNRYQANRDRTEPDAGQRGPSTGAPAGNSQMPPRGGHTPAGYEEDDIPF